MKYQSFCCVCLRETPSTENICELSHIKSKLGFVEINVHFDFTFRTLNFCSSCANKPITIEKLKHIGNHNKGSC